MENLLLLHDLHPLDVDARIQRALDRVRPYLGSHAGGVEYLGVGDGVARLRLEGSCHGCPSSTVTVQLAIEGAVQDAAPEVTEVVVEGMTEPPGPRCCRSAGGPTPGQRASRLPPGGGGRARGLLGIPSPAGCPGAWPVPITRRRQLGQPARHRPPDARPVAAVAGGGRRGLLRPRHPLRLLRRVRDLRLLAGRRELTASG